MARSPTTGLLILVLTLTCAYAVEAPPPPASPPIIAPATPAPVAGALIQVPALTVMRLKLDDPLSSNVNKPGDRFRISVIEDVKVGDVVVIPAGSVGEGEVVHAAKSGAGGKAGELLLTARFLQVGEQTVRLRSLVIGGAGKDRTDAVLATSFVAGPFALFIRGGVIIIPAGTEATAKTLETVQLPAMPPDAAAPPAEAVPATDSPPTEPPAVTPESEQPDGSGQGV